MTKIHTRFIIQSSSFSFHQFLAREVLRESFLFSLPLFALFRHDNKNVFCMNSIGFLPKFCYKATNKNGIKNTKNDEGRLIYHLHTHLITPLKNMCLNVCACVFMSGVDNKSFHG